MLQQIFFTGWAPLLRTAIGTTSAFVILVVMLRLAGPRVLAKWYAFDLVITVALGSSFANTVLAKETSIAQAAVGFLLLIGLQFIISWVVLHWSAARLVVNSRPTAVLLHGHFLDDSMRRQRVAEADIRAAVRQHGLSSIEDVGVVILEADGTFSVVPELSGTCSAVADILELGGSNKANKAK